MIRAEDVAAARTSGVHVYVSPNGDGSGVVGVPGQPLPAVMEADIRALFGPAAPPAPTSATEPDPRMQLHFQLLGSQLPFVLLNAVGPCGGTPDDVEDYHAVDETPEQRAAFLEEVRLCRLPVTYNWHVYNADGYEQLYAGRISPSRFETLEAARADIQPIVDAFPGIPVLDLTT
ncbi:hypothetical protein GC089_18005 [Cellulomonas sp. JZ18]|uniref:hypothetical protein n=1 Tax=Cellulomonas sp. JZ18 TaxID=2654191 RepID=UPI0012D437D2|nr:hypothetical protein [Cellulomonas sp. JZ18]QGQ20737.1 hypothetical protein GC089_18005 [Cellulomonas sp. JZ18]